MSTEYQRVELTSKTESYAFGLVIIKTLTGYLVLAPASDRPDVHVRALDIADKLSAHLDKCASWLLDKDHVAVLHDKEGSRFEAWCNRRQEVMDIIDRLEEVRRVAEVLPVTTDGRECIVCLREEAEVIGWLMPRPFGHVCVCRDCGAELQACPTCLQAVQESLPAFGNRAQPC
jgi:hypothetical protein